MIVAVLLASLGTAIAAALLVRRRKQSVVDPRTELVHQVAALEIAGRGAAESLRRQAEIDARSAGHDALLGFETESRASDEQLAVRALEAERRSLELERRAQQIAGRAAAMATREQELGERDAETRAHQAEIEQAKRMARTVLERIAGERAEEIRQQLTDEWLEQARAAAADRLRRIEAGANDAEHGRTAKRIMTIAVQRFQGHYLTERLLTNLPIAAGSLPLIADDGRLQIIEQVSHVTLTPSETGDSIRLEGQDSFGREIARRAIHRFGKGGVKTSDAQQICEAIAGDLEREVMELGQRAFKELAIPRAHADIVKLVGKLNYRTSYTQNQWKHAIEAAFLCGMMASELGLDVKLARRAALMHDIGKALTHEIDGSHAVIGADLARKLGESEVVANAIGAHHTDEPFNSAYAFLVAAADAMSGARPGARRQQDENYAERIEGLERIGRGYQGVERVHAVHGGREVRIYVQERRISDERAVEMSSEIARKISDELTFPGQIKVTVVREVVAESVAR